MSDSQPPSEKYKFEGDIIKIKHTYASNDFSLYMFYKGITATVLAVIGAAIAVVFTSNSTRKRIDFIDLTRGNQKTAAGGVTMIMWSISMPYIAFSMFKFVYDGNDLKSTMLNNDPALRKDFPLSFQIEIHTTFVSNNIQDGNNSQP